MATTVSFSDSTGCSLTEGEKKHARMMFQYCSLDQSPFLTRAQLQRAVEFFIAQYEGIQDITKKCTSQMLSEITNDQTTFLQFIHMIQLIKSCNKGFRSRPEILLDNKYIMAHLSKKHIVHIDACWGTFDKMKLGYLQKATVKECINLVLKRYDLSEMYNSSSSNKARLTAFNNNYSSRNLQPQDSIQKESLTPQDHRQSSVGEGSLLPTNLNTQTYSPSSQLIVRSNSYDSRLLQKQPSVSFTNSPSSRSNIPNQSSPSGINCRPSAIRNTNSMEQLNSSENSPFQSSPIKHAETSKSSNFSENPRSFQRKSNFFSKGAYDPCQIQKVVDWLDKIELERLVSFEEFANFISQLIIANKLHFSQKGQCQCSIF